MVLSAEPWTVKNLNRDNSMYENLHSMRAIPAQWKLNDKNTIWPSEGPKRQPEGGVNGSLEFLSKYLAAVPRSPSKHNLVAKLRILKPTGDESI
jgi:hypothetical protein